VAIKPVKPPSPDAIPWQAKIFWTIVMAFFALILWWISR